MILDTNALSAFADGDANVKTVTIRAEGVAISAIALGEYRYGIQQSRRREYYEQWLNRYLPTFRFLAIDEETTLAYAELRLELKRAGTPIPSNDLWIAALAVQHKLPILSRDRHFDAVRRVKRINW